MNPTLFALIFALALPAAALADPIKDTTPNIAVTGEAMAEAAPDRATIYFGVQTEKPTAVEAAAENARAAQAAIDELKARGVEAKDVATRSVSLIPITLEDRDPKGVVKQRRTIFRARNELSAKVNSLAKAGEIAGALIDKGANEFQNIEFDVSDAEARRDALRGLAVKDAERRAKAYVEAAGQHLGRVLEIKPEPNEDNAPLRRMERGAAAPMAMSMPAVPLAPGVTKLVERVTVTWALAR